VPDADISRGKDMEKEPSDELIGLERHSLLFIPIGIVPPAERDIAVLDFDDTVIADGNPMGISAKVLKDTLSSVKRRFAVDNPFFMIELYSECLKCSGIIEMTDAAWEYQLTRFKAVFEVVQELAPEQ
jgi:hypothetical protein